MRDVRLIVPTFVYQTIWEPTHGEKIGCSSEMNSTNAVNVMKGREDVGHMPCKLSRMCSYHFNEKRFKYVSGVMYM